MERTKTKLNNMKHLKFIATIIVATIIGIALGISVVLLFSLLFAPAILALVFNNPMWVALYIPIIIYILTNK